MNDDGYNKICVYKKSEQFNYLVGFATKLGGFWQKVKGQIAFFKK